MPQPSRIRKFIAELAAPTQRFTAELSHFNVGENFGVPHTFNPALTVGEAIIAVFVALSRIFLGSVLFALWGVGAWITFAAIGNPILRILALLPFVALFAISLAATMLAVTSIVNWLQRKQPAT